MRNTMDTRDDIMSREQKEQLAQGMHSIVKKYFFDDTRGRVEPVVSYYRYDIKKYTFSIVCTTFDQSPEICLEWDKNLADFRKEMKAYLKEQGFTKMKVMTRKMKYLDSWYNEYIRTKLDAIYFDV